MTFRLNFVVEGQTEETFVKRVLQPNFESLLLADPRRLERYFPESEDEIERLVVMVSGFDSPELIDDDNAPSKRIIGEIREYEYYKSSAGPIVAEVIGLPTLRNRCKHFGEWLTTLEALKEGA